MGSISSKNLASRIAAHQYNPMLSYAPINTLSVS
jgi:hypothetical protein